MYCTASAASTTPSTRLTTLAPVSPIRRNNRPESSSDPNAIARAGKNLHNLDWFEVVETRGHLKDGKIAHWQVKIKIGFRLDP